MTFKAVVRYCGKCDYWANRCVHPSILKTKQTSEGEHANR